MKQVSPGMHFSTELESEPCLSNKDMELMVNILNFLLVYWGLRTSLILRTKIGCEE